MKILRIVNLFMAFLCACLVHHVHGLPQAGRNWLQPRPNATAYSTRFQQKVQPTVVANSSSLQQPHWQRANATRLSQGGIYQPQGERLWINNNQSHPHIQVPGLGNRQNFATPRQASLSSYQPQGERLWINNNQSHPHIQVPGLGNRQNFATPRQASLSSYQPQGERLWINNNQSHPHIQVPGLGNRQNFATPKQMNRSISLGTASTLGWRAPPSYEIYGSVRNNSTQNYPATSQSIKNPSWSGYSSTVGTWNTGRPTYNSTSGGQNVGPMSGWVAPLNPLNNGNRSGAASNSPSGGGVNTYPNFNSRLPGNALISGNNNQSAFLSSGSVALAPINPGSNSGTPLAPLAGGTSWNSNPPLAGLSYSNGPQQPQARPTGNSNPYTKLFK